MKKLAIIIVLLTFTANVNAQWGGPWGVTGKGIIYAFDNNTKKLTHILSYDAVLGKEGAAIIEKFENSSFLTGFIKGDFKENDGWISPKSESMLVVLRDNSSLFDKDISAFSEKNQYPGTDVFLPVEKFLPGDMFDINFDGSNYGRPPMPYGILKVEVIKNDKNQTVLKVL